MIKKKNWGLLTAEVPFKPNESSRGHQQDLSNTEWSWASEWVAIPTPGTNVKQDAQLLPKMITASGSSSNIVYWPPLSVLAVRAIHDRQ